MQKPITSRSRANDLHAQLNVLFWNLGRQTNDKLTEHKNKASNHDADVLGIVEVGAASDNLLFFHVGGYSEHHGTMHSSDIIILVKKLITSKFIIRKKMTVL